MRDRDGCLHCDIIETIAVHPNKDLNSALEAIVTTLCELIAAGVTEADRRRMMEVIIADMPKVVIGMRKAGQYPGGNNHILGHVAPKQGQH